MQWDFILPIKSKGNLFTLRNVTIRSNCYKGAVWDFLDSQQKIDLISNCHTDNFYY
jgi:hypothetical protein